MHRDVGAKHAESTLVTVSLPPLPSRLGPGPGPGTAHRVAGRPPTPPPRPESSFMGPPPPPPTVTSSPASGPGRGQGVDSLASATPSTQPVSLQLPASLSSLDTPLPTPITLTNPRSASSRAQNLYVDTPFKGPAPAPSVTSVSGSLTTKLPHIRSHHALPPPSTVKSRNRPITVSPGALSHMSHLPPTNSVSVITTPPFSSDSSSPKTAHLDKLTSTVTQPNSPTNSGSDSIICVMCGRCRCTACGTAKPLPSTWLCDNTCLCSAESLVDTVSCMCCVKAAFYHCGEKMAEDTDKEDSWVDSPCSCSHNKWWLRWPLVAFLSLPLPCLLCYPVLKGLTAGAEYCYQAAMVQGCRCPDHSAATSPVTTSPTQSSLSSPTDSHKRLLG